MKVKIETTREFEVGDIIANVENPCDVMVMSRGNMFYRVGLEDGYNGDYVGKAMDREDWIYIGNARELAKNPPVPEGIK